MDTLQIYATLLLTGFILIGFEIFLPGGVLGIMGGIAWLAAAIVGLNAFPAPYNILSAVGLLFIGVFTFVVWMRYFPKSRIGKSLTLQEDGAEQKAHSADEQVPVGATGEALSTLRPSGIVMIDGERVDVVAQGEWIEAGSNVQVISTSGGHVSVVKAEPESTE